MIPNLYYKDHYNNYVPRVGAPIPNTAMLPTNMMGMEYMEHQNALGRAQANMQANIQANTSIDSLLHVHRRKLQRRAANRKSAQLSRARKKAHLEELTVENTRLQSMVDVLDSQPELIFCINARGDITYISERTINFVSLTNSGDDPDVEPSHISQILAKDSVENVLKTIQEIMKVSPPKSALAESSMLFSAKVVEFRDSFGNPLIGYMRCARVNRRVAPEEVTDDLDNDTASEQFTAPPAQGKKAKLNHDAKAMELQRITSSLPYMNTTSGNGLGGPPMQISNLGMEEWNLTNFKMLTDCVSNLADRHDKSMRDGAGISKVISEDSAGNNSARSMAPVASSSLLSGYPQQQQQQQQQQLLPDPESESEFVCVIRTSDSCFARYSTRSDLYMFVSTPLSAASMEAHDQKSKDTVVGLRHPSSHGSSGSSDPTGQTTGDNSSKPQDSSGTSSNSSLDKTKNKNGGVNSSISNNSSSNNSSGSGSGGGKRKKRDKSSAEKKNSGDGSGGISSGCSSD